jgi:hypothetical protein
MRSDVLKAEGITRNRGASKPLRESFLPLTQNEKHPTALRTNTLLSRISRAASRVAAGERGHWQILGAFAALGLLSSACTGDLPQFTQGTTGNGIQTLKPPVEVPHFDSGPHIISEACFTSPAAMNCSKSFSNDIYPKMQSTGAWKCAAGACHGGSTPPAIGDGNAPGAYASLIAYTSDPLGAYYVTPCTGNDLSQSSIVCNLGADPTGFCSSPMPQGGVGAALLTMDEQNDLRTWIGCGAPNN